MKICELGERQRQVIELLREGLTYKQISYRLGISHKTVRTYMARACIRLGLPPDMDRIHLILVMAERECGCRQLTTLRSENVSGQNVA